MKQALSIKVAPYLKKTYTEYRIKQNIELAQMAFINGSSLLGTTIFRLGFTLYSRFTQPLSPNTPLPGYSTADLIGLNILDKLEGTFIKPIIN